MYADLTLLSVYAQDAALRLLVAPPSTAAPLLTPRELEALRWTGEGKTAWDTSQIMAISQGTVEKFLQNAQAKLDTVNKTGTVVKAVRLGLI